MSNPLATNTPADTAVATSRAPAVSLAWLTFAGASSPFGFNFVGPVLPALQEAYALEGAQVQWLVSIYSLMLGLGQLIVGPVADAWGRRPALLAGLAMVTVGSVGAMMAQSFEQLVWWRCLQGFGACTTLVVPRAVVRDLYTRPDEIARAIAVITLVLSVMPGIAPLIAGALLTWFSWRSGFAAFAVLGAVSFVLALRCHPETLRPGARASLNPWELLKTYARIAVTPRFMAYACSYSLLNSGVIAYLVMGAGALQRQYGYGAWGAAVGLLVVYAGFSTGNLYAAWHIRRVGVNRMLGMGLAVAIAGALLTLLGVWLSSAVAAVMLPLFINSIGAGLAFPSGIAGAVSLQTQRAGTAAALVGATQLVLCAGVAVIAGIVANGSFVPLAWMVFAAAMASAVCIVPVYARRDAA